MYMYSYYRNQRVCGLASCEFSNYRQYGMDWISHVGLYSTIMTLKSGGPCTLGPLLPEREGVRTPGAPQDRGR